MNININYEALSDEDLVFKGREGDHVAFEHILTRYKSMVNSKSRAYFLVGADREDLIQEGMIGLFKAMRDFDSEKDCRFGFFAELCVTRQIITAVKTATRQKHMPLNSYVSLNKPVFEEESQTTWSELISNGDSDPEFLIIEDEVKQDVKNIINSCLSHLEKEVLQCYLKGLSYTEISERVEITVKSVDNALQRIKKKLNRAMFVEKAEKLGEKNSEKL